MKSVVEGGAEAPLPSGQHPCRPPGSPTEQSRQSRQTHIPVVRNSTSPGLQGGGAAAAGSLVVRF